MPRQPKSRGLFVLVHREGEGNDGLFRWGIYRRRIPFGVKLSEGGFGSYHAALTAGKKALAELLEQIQQEEEKGCRCFDRL
jgi:hypothetical protein